MKIVFEIVFYSLIFYFVGDGVVVDNVRGRVVILGLGVREETTPGVLAKDSECLCGSDCEVSYSSGLDVVKRETPQLDIQFVQGTEDKGVLR